MPDQQTEAPWQKTWGPASKPAAPGAAASTGGAALPWQKDWSGQPQASIQPTQEFTAKNTAPVDVGSYLPPNFDTKSGVGFMDLRDYLAADNDKEKQLFIDAGTKAGKWQGGGKLDTPIGEYWYVNKNGKPTAIAGTDQFWTYPLAGAAAHPFQSVLMMGSMLLPEARPATILESGGQASFSYALKRLGTGTAYNFARSAFVGAASAAGAAIDDATKAFRDLWSKSSDEEKGMLTVAFATGMMPEFGMRAGGSIARTVANGYAPVLSPAERQMTMSALEHKLTPLVEQATHGHSALLPIEQSMASYIFGNPAEARNTSAMAELVKQKLLQGGVPAKNLDQSFARVMDAVRARVDTSQASATLRTEAAQRMGLREESLTAQRGALASQLDSHLRHIEAGLKSPDPELQKLAQQGLIQARIKFGQGGRALANDATKLAHDAGQPVVVDMTEIKAAAKQAREALPRDEKGDLIFPNHKQLSGILAGIENAPGQVDLANIHDWRSELFHAGEYKNLTPTREQTAMQRLGRLLDEQMNQEGPNGINKPVKAALDKLDAYWKEGIQAFKGARVRMLAKDPNARVLLAPEDVADSILVPGQAPEAERIKGLLGPEMWQKVADAFWGKLKMDARNDLTGALDPVKFRKEVVKYQDVLESAFGRSRAQAIEDFSKKAAAFEGKIPADSLTPDNFYFKLRDLQAAQTQHEATLKSGYIQMLMDQSHDKWDAIEYMLSPAHPDRILAAKQFWGEGTPQWREVQAGAMTQLLSKSVGPDRSLLKVIFKPGALTDALKPYTRAQLDALFGPENASALRELAQVIDFVTKRPRFAQTGTFATAYIALHPLGHVRKLVELALTGRLLANPGFVRWLTQGMKSGTQETWNQLGNAVKAGVYAITPMIGHSVSQ